MDASRVLTSALPGSTSGTGISSHRTRFSPVARAAGIIAILASPPCPLPDTLSPGHEPVYPVVEGQDVQLPVPVLAEGRDRQAGVDQLYVLVTMPSSYLSAHIFPLQKSP